eukprot:m.22392 g.22392  ORF g.22392 m.22392 type:complete len:128 (-) comp7395_c0_seq1:157-540(-)
MKMEKPPKSEEQKRFEVELEFVQCLANPQYVLFLAQQGFLEDSTFVNYLQYLLYWKQPEYLKYIRYPQCLFFLDLLQNERLRPLLKSPYYAKLFDEQQLRHWQFYDQNRAKDVVQLGEELENSPKEG